MVSSRPTDAVASSISLDFNILNEYVLVEASMIIKPKLKESSKLFLHGNRIELLSISTEKYRAKSQLWFSLWKWIDISSHVPWESWIAWTDSTMLGNKRVIKKK